MKEYALYFIAGCATGLAIPFFFGTLSRNKKPKQPEQEEDAQKDEQNNNQEQQNKVLDQRFLFPQPSFDYNGEYKLVTVVRMDVQIPTNQLASLVGDIAIKAVVETKKINQDNILQWLYFGQAKIVTKAPNLDVMNQLIEKAKETKIPYVTINNDKGEPLILGVGPAPVDDVNPVTSHLKLF